MFIGHFGVGLGAKKVDGSLSLGTLLLASLLPDLLMPIFLLTGIEKVRIDPGNTAFNPLDLEYYPFSHSLVGVLVQAIVVALVCLMVKKSVRSSILLGALVIMHWVLDLISHRPDLQLVPWSEFRVGLGLWNSVVFTLLFELTLFFTGVFLFVRATKAKNAKGTVGLVSLLVFLFVLYLLSAFGPPPPSAKPVAYTGLLQWLIIGWAYWIDRNRHSIIEAVK